MAKRLDFKLIQGNKYNMLTILSEADPHTTSGGNKHRVANCICDCGTKCSIRISPILSGTTKSCGCYSRRLASDSAKVRNTKHGSYSKPEYNVYRAMLKRCLNANNKAYKDYGGRGITVCERWMQSYENFITDMGERPSNLYSIDRINVDGNYEPDNCRWATRSEQARNQRNNVLITYDGETKCVSEWALTVGISVSALYYRYCIAKWSAEDTLTLTLNHNNNPNGKDKNKH